MNGIRIYIAKKYWAFRTYFQKHDFDLENPAIEVIVINGIPQNFPIYFCKKCDKYLCLDRKSMDLLPFDMSHGCNKIKNLDGSVFGNSG